MKKKLIFTTIFLSALTFGLNSNVRVLAMKGNGDDIYFNKMNNNINKNDNNVHNLNFGNNSFNIGMDNKGNNFGLSNSKSVEEREEFLLREAYDVVYTSYYALLCEVCYEVRRLFLDLCNRCGLVVSSNDKRFTRIASEFNSKNSKKIHDLILDISELYFDSKLNNRFGIDEIVDDENEKQRLQDGVFNLGDLNRIKNIFESKVSVCASFAKLFYEILCEEDFVTYVSKNLKYKYEILCAEDFVTYFSKNLKDKKDKWDSFYDEKNTIDIADIKSIFEKIRELLEKGGLFNSVIECLNKLSNYDCEQMVMDFCYKDKDNKLKSFLNEVVEALGKISELWRKFDELWESYDGLCISE